MRRQLAAGDADQAGPRPQRRVAAHRRRRQVRLARRHDDRAQPGEGRERLRRVEPQLRERQAQRLDQVVGLGRRDRRRHVGDRMVDVGRADQHRAFPDVGEHRPAVARMQPGEAAAQRHGLAREHEVAAAQRPQHRRARRRAGPDAGGMHGHGRRHLGARAVEPVLEARAGDAAAALDQRRLDMVEGARALRRRRRRSGAAPAGRRRRRRRGRRSPRAGRRAPSAGSSASASAGAMRRAVRRPAMRSAIQNAAPRASGPGRLPAWIGITNGCGSTSPGRSRSRRSRSRTDSSVIRHCPDLR